MFSILKVDTGSSCLFSLSLPSLLISIPGLCPLMFLQESFSFIEPRLYIHLSLHVKRWTIDLLFVRTGVLIWTIQPLINHWEWLPSTSTWLIGADCFWKTICVLLCSWLLFCVSLGSLILRPQSAAHKRSLFLSCGFPFLSSAPVTLTAGRCGCSAEHPVYSPGLHVSSVHLQVSSSRGHGPLLGCLLSLW